MPAFMSAKQFVENGADEIQHINFIELNFLFPEVKETRNRDRFIKVAERAREFTPEKKEVADPQKKWDEFMDELVKSSEQLGKVVAKPDATFQQAEEAFVTYRVVTKTGDEFRNTEFFVFAGDKLERVDVYFGASYHDGKFVKQKAVT